MADPERPEGIRDYAPGELLDEARKAAQRVVIERVDLFVRQIFRESRFNQDAKGDAGEIGVAQFTEEWLQKPPIPVKSRVEDWRWDPIESLSRAARYMKQLLASHGDRWDLALGEYNAGRSPRASR